MAGAQKRRQQKERKDATASGNGSSSNEQSSPSPTSDQSPKTESPPTRFDGNRDPAVRSRSQSASGTGRTQVIAQAGGSQYGNFEVGFGGREVVAGYGHGENVPKRPGLNSSGAQAVKVKLNTFNVLQLPQVKINQWDVVVQGKGAEKPAVIKKVMASNTFAARLNEDWIFDGNKLAWSKTMPKDNREEERIEVNMDQEQGRQPRTDRATGQPKEPDVFRVTIKRTKLLDFGSLNAYLAGQGDFNVACLEAVNFLDHSFFDRGTQRHDLGGGLEAFKGVYASMRLACSVPGPKPTAVMSVNVDVNNTAFWKESSLMQIAAEITGCPDARRLETILRVGTAGSQVGRLRTLKKLMCYTRHITTMSAEEQKKRPMKINAFLNKTPAQQMIKDVQLTENSPARDMSVQEYFQKKWNKRLQFPGLPVVEMQKQIAGRRITVPMELLFLSEAQRYVGRLSTEQTPRMLAFAATPPGPRWAAVEQGKAMLNWGRDQYLNSYGLRISEQPEVVSAKVLTPPEVTYANGKAEPRTTGRWMLKGKKFFRGSQLDAWGVFVLPDRRAPTEQQITGGMSALKGILSGHGVRVASEPFLYTQPPQMQLADAIPDFWQKTGNKFMKRPQLLVFILPNKDKTTYERIKKGCEMRPNIGVVSQCMQGGNFTRGPFNDQYGSNVSAKINAKLGGVSAKATSLVRGKKPEAPNNQWVPQGSMFIGGDVTHGVRNGGMGESVASIAALTFSADLDYIKYWAGCATNGVRLEMITKDNIQRLVTKFARKWLEQQQGRLPTHVFYVRDGVSEGQYSQVLNSEMRDIQSALNAIDAKKAASTKYVCIVGGKRHHVRFFPEAGDKNGNPLPGTLVETGVTHPREFDFYLCAHSAIKGTARPMHYQVIRNDSALKVDNIQGMLYEASYQYVKSTTPVSIFPAAYYAHLAAARARAHEDARATAVSSADQATNVGSDTALDGDTYPLMTPGKENNWEYSMWYC